MGGSKGDTLLLVFNDKNKISDEGMKEIENSVDKLNENKDKLKITGITDPFGTPAAKDQLISKDKTTLLVQVSFEKGTRDNKTVVNAFKNSIKDVKVNHYITGELAISNDYMGDVGKGVDKSATITVIFILLILILMFRSVVTPFISLLAVGISYLCSMGIIGILIHAFNFSITSLTQMFVILVLFGIGTDYHILLFNRFKEELGHGLSVEEAVVTSYKTAGKTIIYSGLTVFMGFASLSFVEFPVYRSANAVAIGIAVLLIEIMTFTPLMMRVLGAKLFWSSKKSAGHKESKLWGGITAASVNHPVLSLIAAAVIMAPIIIFNAHTLSFDSLKDMNGSEQSLKGFNIVKDKFGAGKAMPTTIVIKNSKAMDSNKDLAVIDDLTNKLKSMKGIKEVSGPTQPKGEIIKDLYTDKQTKTVVNGLSDANDGIGKIGQGLDKIDDSLSAPDFSDVKKLSSGTGKLENGMSAVTDGLKKVDSGISQGADGAASLAKGTAQLKTGVVSINGGLKDISANLDKIKEGYAALGKGYKALPDSIKQLKNLTGAMQQSISKIDGKLPNDPDVAALKAMNSQLSDALDSMAAGINKANSNYDTLTSGLDKLDGGVRTMMASTDKNSQLVKGIDKLQQGANALSQGLRKGSAGQEKIISSMSQLKDGAGEVKNGQEALYEGLSTMGSGMTQLKNGVTKSNDGLSKVSNGIDKTNDFLTQLTTTKSFYIPKEAMNSKDIKKMLDAYMSKDRKIAKLTVAFESEPYADSSIKLIDNMKEVVKNQLKGTELKNADYGISGVTATANDLSNIATHDISFTQIIVLAAILILLIIVIRSFWIPVYIVGSLLAAYYTALSATAFISKQLFSSAQHGLSWNVPFFSFVMIAALGVDYSIFLMTRFKEYPSMTAKEAIVTASKNVGGVVISAAIILAGTFATLYPSRLIVLMELAICVVIGLLLLSLILLPIVIPALMAVSQNLSLKSKHEADTTLADQQAV